MKIHGIKIPDNIKFSKYTDHGKYCMVVYDDNEGIINMIESATKIGLYNKFRREWNKVNKQKLETTDLNEGDKDDRGIEIENLNRIIDNEISINHIGLDNLSTRERKILEFRFGLKDYYIPHTLEETAVAFHVTRERIRQFENRALKRLKEFNKKS